jgi:hypothetical protein
MKKILQIILILLIIKTQTQSIGQQGMCQGQTPLFTQTICDPEDEFNPSKF